MCGKYLCVARKDQLEAMDDVNVAKEKTADPNGFLDELASSCRALVVKICIAKLRPCATQWLKRHGLEWEGVKPVLLEQLEEFYEVSN